MSVLNVVFFSVWPDLRQSFEDKNTTVSEPPDNILAFRSE